MGARWTRVFGDEAGASFLELGFTLAIFSALCAGTVNFLSDEVVDSFSETAAAVNEAGESGVIESHHGGDGEDEGDGEQQRGGDGNPPGNPPSGPPQGNPPEEGGGYCNGCNNGESQGARNGESKGGDSGDRSGGRGMRGFFGSMFGI